MDDITFVDLSDVNLTLEVQSPEIDLTLDLNSHHARGIPSYTHMQNVAALTWTINHNLGYNPIVQLFNSGSQLVSGQVTHTSFNQVVVTFSMPVSGFARLI